ncbi:MAG: class I SAM-dependent methyltransferase [Verrucomicrobiae bacterium]|nr:class I SAM-dependent methyltransferase [Verrucomicrobiae bacterium]
MSFHPNAEFYDRIASSYDAIAHASEREVTELGLDALNVSNGESVLEIGYGTGHALIRLAKAVGETGKVTGVDVSEGMRKVASKLVADEGVSDQVDLQVSAAPPLNFGDGSFDAVFLSFTLELFPDDELKEMVREIGRVLKPGGQCGIVAMAKPRGEKEDTPLEKVYVWMHRHFPHIVDCHPIDAEKALSAEGLEIIHADHREIWTLPVAIVVARKPS